VRTNAIFNYCMTALLDCRADGDGSLPDTDMFAKFPRTPGESQPATPITPRRRIRCKMCRFVFTLIFTF
jgi:hypothetical protein